MEFDILRQGGIVDQIMRCEALIIQNAKEGDRFISTFDREKIVVEVPSKSSWPEWNKELFKALETDGRKKGMNKKQAKEYASGVIREWRMFSDMRVKEKP